MTAALILALLLLPQRDVRPPIAAAPGTAAIRGIVVSDHTPARPLRRARVTLNGTGLSPGRTTITADDGTFVFDMLPPGRYRIAAMKDGWPSRMTPAITLGAGETHRTRLTLLKGGAITGVITDAEGAPVQGMAVRALAYKYVPSIGERRPLAQGHSASPSDDRGVYRIFGLPPGDYMIEANTREPGPLPMSDLRRLTGGTVGTRPLTLAPSYYPGTADISRAAVVTVTAAQERTGIDVPLQYVPLATVSGIAPVNIGLSPATLLLVSIGDTAGGMLTRSATADAEGRFTFRSIGPGAYSVLARSGSATAGGLWGKTDILVDGEDLPNVTIALQPTLTIAGRVVFEGTRPAPSIAGMTVPIFAATTGLGNWTAPLPSVKLEPDNRFRISGVLPGKYRFVSPAIRNLSTSIGGWWLKSIVIDGRDLLDGQLIFDRSTDEAVATFSDQASEITGVVTDARSLPLPDQLVLVFSADAASWFPNSRRVAAVTTDASGRYSIRNLPTGQYRLVTDAQLEANEWFDPAVLQRLSPAATPITLTGVEKTIHDIVVK
jgi:protocatechuate 3,4-dioxygenase beta subunit